MGGPRVVTEEVIEYVADLLGRRLKKHEIKAHIYEELEIECSPSTVELLITRARGLMLQRSTAPKSQHFSNAIEFYEAIIKDTKVSIRDRLLAQARLDNLLGLERQFNNNDGSTPD